MEAKEQAFEEYWSIITDRIFNRNDPEMMRQKIAFYAGYEYGKNTDNWIPIHEGEREIGKKYWVYISHPTGGGQVEESIWTKYQDYTPQFDHTLHRYITYYKPYNLPEPPEDKSIPIFCELQ